MDFDSRARTWDDNPTKSALAQAVGRAIHAQVALDPQMSALEYGCGTGLLSFVLREQLGQITLADSSSGMLAVLEEKIASGAIDNMTALKLDLANDPLPRERFDLVYSQMTLHHIDDTDGVLRALHALLKSPGTLCLADLDSEDGSFHGADFAGHRGFDRETLQRQATAAGFRNIRFTTAFTIRKTEAADAEKEFPVFLLVAEKR